jgi:hypothetical protein
MKKILLSIFASFIISFTIFVVLIQTFHDQQNEELFEDEISFYESIQDIENKIFLVGGSHISALNPFFIEEYLTENNKDFEVFNLAKMASRPQNEIKNLDLLISSEPKIVVYCISARDFADIQSVNQPKIKSDQPLPDPLSLIDTWFNNQNTDLLILQPGFSPKLITLKELRGVTVNPDDYIKAPFFRFDYKRDFNAMPDDELKLDGIAEAKPVNIRLPNENRDLSSLKEIIDRLQQNNIKVILFASPQHKYLYDLVDDSEKIAFKKILTNIHDTTNLEIHLFTDKYSDLEIWRNTTHIVVSKSASIFSIDIAKLIVEELK